jgi:hypothetical protein
LAGAGIGYHVFDRSDRFSGTTVPADNLPCAWFADGGLTSAGVLVLGSLLLGFVDPGVAAAPGSGGVWDWAYAEPPVAKAMIRIATVELVMRASSGESLRFSFHAAEEDLNGNSRFTRWFPFRIQHAGGLILNLGPRTGVCISVSPLAP